MRKIDNGYLVAWHEQMDYKIARAGSSLLGSFLSGEGFVCSFTGAHGLAPAARLPPAPWHTLSAIQTLAVPMYGWHKPLPCMSLLRALELSHVPGVRCSVTCLLVQRC